MLLRFEGPLEAFWRPVIDEGKHAICAKTQKCVNETIDIPLMRSVGADSA